MYLKNKSKYLGIRVSNDTFDMLCFYSSKMNMTLSSFIRFILESYIISLKGKV